MLGETKGRGNDKPSPKYHPMILKLLYSDLVDGIKGGGHDPANNFSIGDLPKEQADRLMKFKPQMLPLHDRIKKFGFNSSVIAEIENKLDENDIEYVEIKSDFSIMKEWNDVEDFYTDLYISDPIYGKSIKDLVTNRKIYR